MTLEQITECTDPSVLEKLTDQELNDIFKPFFPAARPEMIKRDNSLVKKPSTVNQKALDIMKQHGIDMSDIFGRGK
jgi:hypothetical protein